MTLSSLLEEAQTGRDASPEALSIGVIAPLLQRRGYDVTRVDQYDHVLADSGQTRVTSLVMNPTTYTRNPATSFDRVEHLGYQGRYGDIYDVKTENTGGRVLIEESNQELTVWESLKRLANGLTDPPLKEYNATKESINDFLSSTHRDAQLLRGQRQQVKQTMKQAYDVVQTFDEAMAIAPNAIDIHVDKRRHDSNELSRAEAPPLDYEVVIAARPSTNPQSLPSVDPPVPTTTHDESLEAMLRRVSTEALQPYTVRRQNEEDQIGEHKAKIAPKLYVADTQQGSVRPDNILSVPLPYPEPWTQRT